MYRPRRYCSSKICVDLDGHKKGASRVPWSSSLLLGGELYIHTCAIACPLYAMDDLRSSTPLMVIGLHSRHGQRSGLAQRIFSEAYALDFCRTRRSAQQSVNVARPSTMFTWRPGSLPGSQLRSHAESTLTAAT
jgi:hypothetical protein